MVRHCFLQFFRSRNIIQVWFFLTYKVYHKSNRTVCRVIYDWYSCYPVVSACDVISGKYIITFSALCSHHIFCHILLLTSPQFQAVKRYRATNRYVRGKTSPETVEKLQYDYGDDAIQTPGFSCGTRGSNRDARAWKTSPGAGGLQREELRSTLSLTLDLDCLAFFGSGDSGLFY